MDQKVSGGYIRNNTIRAFQESCAKPWLFSAWEEAPREVSQSPPTSQLPLHLPKYQLQVRC